MKNYLLIGVLSLFVLVGAGCLGEATIPAQDANEEETEEMNEEMEDTEVENETEIEIETEVESEDVAEVVTLDLTGRNFAFSDEEIRVNVGDTVRVNFTSTDGFHNWMVDGFAAATGDVNTGESTSVTFVADKAGQFEYYCGIGQHREMGMVGTLIVE